MDFKRALKTQQGFQKGPTRTVLHRRAGGAAFLPLPLGGVGLEQQRLRVDFAVRELLALLACRGLDYIQFHTLRPQQRFDNAFLQTGITVEVVGEVHADGAPLPHL